MNNTGRGVLIVGVAIGVLVIGGVTSSAEIFWRAMLSFALIVAAVVIGWIGCAVMTTPDSD